jgi:TonB family protein
MAFALAFGAYRLRAPGPSRPAQVAATKVDFRVMADPEEAEILLDGVVLGKGEYQGTRDRTGKQHELSIRAPGYQPRQEQIRFDGDVIKLVRLEREPGSTAPEPRPASDGSSDRPHRWRALQDMVDSASRSATSPRPAAPSAPRGPELRTASAAPTALAVPGASTPTPSAAVVAPPPPPPPSTAALAPTPAAPAVKTTLPRLAPGCAPPRYPERSLERGEEGLVNFRFLIDVDGSVKSAELTRSSGSGRLDDAARRAFEKCKFVPATVNGQPKQGWVNQPFRWQIK